MSSFIPLSQFFDLATISHLQNASNNSCVAYFPRRFEESTKMEGGSWKSLKYSQYTVKLFLRLVLSWAAPLDAQNLCRLAHPSRSRVGFVPTRNGDGPCTVPGEQRGGIGEEDRQS